MYLCCVCASRAAYRRRRRQLLKHAIPAAAAIHFTTNMHFAVCLWRCASINAAAARPRCRWRESDAYYMSQRERERSSIVGACMPPNIFACTKTPSAAEVPSAADAPRRACGEYQGAINRSVWRLLYFQPIPSALLFQFHDRIFHSAPASLHLYCVYRNPFDIRHKWFEMDFLLPTNRKIQQKVRWHYCVHSQHIIYHLLAFDGWILNG